MNGNEGRKHLLLMVGALGVVYGDIGTSPLYALRECFSGPHGIEPSPQHVLGVISLIFWSLTLIVSVKYLMLVMRADNKGEGGILALLSLALPDRDPKGTWKKFLAMMGIFGAALLYGDGMITPAVTVLGAVEGVQVAFPVLERFVVPMAVVILFLLFRIQRFGAGRVGAVFGGIMLFWFGTLAALGIHGIIQAPQVLAGLSPHHGISFLLHSGHQAFVVLGAVFLSVTGAEALYADMGHFGRRAIRRAWFYLVFPALLLNYLGEGALLLVRPEAARNPFYMLAPSWAVLPLVVLATFAAVIASQALISGAFSLTMQAAQMGYLPRLRVQHTSHAERGQIYMPQVNTILMLACIGLVLHFQTSSRLAGAYGIAVSLTMLMTTLLFFAAARRLWGWGLPLALSVCGVFLVVEGAFTGANALKILHGGWFPLTVGFLLFTMMTTWHRGRTQLRTKLSESYLPMELFLKDLDAHTMHRVPGTAVFLSGNPRGTPIALLHNLRHNKVLHEKVVIMTIQSTDVPVMALEERFRIEQLRPDIHRVVASYGYMEQPDVPDLLRLCHERGLKTEPVRTTFFLSRETILSRSTTRIPRWRKRLFAAMSRNATSAAAYFQLPPNRVVELGMQVEV